MSKSKKCNDTLRFFADWWQMSKVFACPTCGARGPYLRRNPKCSSEWGCPNCGVHVCGEPEKFFVKRTLLIEECEEKAS